MPLRLRSAGGGGVTLKPPVALSTEAAIEVPAYDGAKMLTNKTPGCVLQVNHGIATAPVVVSGGTTYTVVSVTITPSNASNKVMLMAHVSGYQSYDTLLYFARNGIKVGAGDAAGSRSTGYAELGGAQRSNESGNAAGFFLDSPGTTSAITYSVVLVNSSTTAYINRTGIDNDAAYDSRTTSTITAMEIAG